MSFIEMGTAHALVPDARIAVASNATPRSIDLRMQTPIGSPRSLPGGAAFA
jgi:hypothetical protein